MALLGHVIFLYGNSDGEPRDTEVTFGTSAKNNLTTQMRKPRGIDKYFVIFVITGLQRKDFGSCSGRINFNY